MIFLAFSVCKHYLRAEFRKDGGVVDRGGLENR